jgi:dihydroorotase
MVIRLKQIQRIDGSRQTLHVESDDEIDLDASSLLLLPALIDPHVHFRTPGAEYKEDWISASRAALAGGVTTVLDMPNTSPPTSTEERLHDKKRLIDQMLEKAQIPLRYGLYLGAEQGRLDQISRGAKGAIGLKIYMGTSTGGLLLSDRSALKEAFQRAKESDLLVAVHAEDEAILVENRSRYAHQKNPAIHSLIRSPAAAAAAVEASLRLAEETGARLYIVHTSTEEELTLIRAAKKKGLPVYAEATPHHLFLSEDDYQRLGTLAIVNPPLRSRRQQEKVWEAIAEGLIDTLGTDHAPHLLAEKGLPYGEAPAGFPSIELYLPLLLDAYLDHKISLAAIVALTSTNPQSIFRLPPSNDWVAVDLQEKRTIDHASLKTKARWSPYVGKEARGWPKYVVLRNRWFDLSHI